ncbi:Subtilase family protein [Frankineae bacterium MT45]|nr:Subtilase family protein [Frankineae bacterium MT45]
MRGRLGRSARVLVALATCVAVVAGQTGTATAVGPPGYPEWWFDTWGVQALWNAGARGGGITIAEIDTGVNAQVPEITSSLVPGFDFGVPGGIGYVDHEIKSFGHGTAMASLMVAKPSDLGVVGLAPDAKVMPIALPIDGTNDAAGSGADHLPDAIRWAADNGGKIISMSLGGERDPAEDSVPCPSDEQAAITYAISKGLIVVAASGNAGDEGSPVEDPGVCLGVVSVGAVDSANNVASFSSRHPYLTTTAPGVNIPTLSRVPGHVFHGDGTSQSTALVSAALALIWSKFPKLTGRQIVSKAISSFDKRSLTRDPAYGFGIINPNTAIHSGNPNARNVVYDSVEPYVSQLEAADAETALKSPPSTTNTHIPGSVIIGPAPSPWSSAVVAALLVALLGLVLLVLLMLGGLRSRRRRAASAQTTAQVYGFAAGSGQFAGPPQGWHVVPETAGGYPDQPSAAQPHLGHMPPAQASAETVQAPSPPAAVSSVAPTPTPTTPTPTAPMQPPRPIQRTVLPSVEEEDAAQWQDVISAEERDL